MQTAPLPAATASSSVLAQVCGLYLTLYPIPYTVNPKPADCDVQGSFIHHV